MKYLFSLILPLLFSNCVSTVNQYAARRALVVEKAALVQRPLQTIWQVEDKYYAQGSLCQARGVQKGVPINSVLYQQPTHTFTPTSNSGELVYVEITTHESGDISQAPEQQLFISGSSYLTALPPGARRITRTQLPTAVTETVVPLVEPTTDAHCYYAYPLAGLTAVAIDLPATVVMTTALIPAAVVYGTYAKLHSIFRQEQKN